MEPTRFYCTKPHLNGQKGMYHYSDEWIYEKHLTEDVKVEPLKIRN